MSAGSGGAARLDSGDRQLHEIQAEMEMFASHICHDVEESLRVINAFAAIIEEHRGGELSEEERSLLQNVFAASGRLRLMLRSFLSYCQVGRSRHVSSGPVDLRIVAQSALQSLRTQVEKTGAVIRLDGSFPVVRGDFAELQQVFEQVILNAILYRKPGSTPAVNISASQSTAGEWNVNIDDNGPGIPARHQALIFLPFKRLHGREIPGSGMGLAIVKRIMESHEGRVWVEASASGGARFRLGFPASAET